MQRLCSAPSRVLVALALEHLLDATLPLLQPPLLLRHPLVRLCLLRHHHLLQRLLPQRLVELPDLVQGPKHLHRPGPVCATSERTAETMLHGNARAPKIQRCSGASDHMLSVKNPVRRAESPARVHKGSGSHGCTFGSLHSCISS